MVQSMTAFGRASGSEAGWVWEWEIRALNGRGLDLKLRLPDGFSALEPALRKIASKAIARGSVSAGLRLSRQKDLEGAEIDRRALVGHIDAARQVREAAAAADLPLAELSVGHLMSLPGVLAGEVPGGDASESALGTAIGRGFSDALAALKAMRAQEGAGLATLLNALVDDVEAGCRKAEDMAPERAAHQETAFTAALDRVKSAGDNVEKDRIAQEVAVIAVKGDVSEELDRLRLHIAAARELLAQPGAIGRKLDFLTQEFNREANTLCSKSQYGPLTQIGLDLKAAIDQMREQVQNVE